MRMVMHRQCIRNLSVSQLDSKHWPSNTVEYAPWRRYPTPRMVSIRSPDMPSLRRTCTMCWSSVRVLPSAATIGEYAFAADAATAETTLTFDGVTAYESVDASAPACFARLRISKSWK